MPRKESNVSNLWKYLTFKCGHNVAPEGEKPRRCGATPDQKMVKNVPCLQCPVCGTVVSFYEIEKVVSKISDRIVQDAEDDIDSNLTNERFSHRSTFDHITTVVVVTKDDRGKLELAVDLI